MDKLRLLASVAKAGFSLEVNPFLGFYQGAEDYFANASVGWEPVGDIDWERDIWEVQAYPRTPVGFIYGISNDPELLIEWAIEGCR